MEEIINRNSIKFKILGLVLFSLALITLTLGYSSFQFSKNRIIDMLKDSLAGTSSAVASFISPEDAAFIIDNAESIKRSEGAYYEPTPERDPLEPIALDKNRDLPKSPTGTPRIVYDKYSEILRRIKKANNIDSSINIYVASGNTLLLVMTSEPSYMVGTPYNMRPEAKNVLLYGYAQTTDIYNDKDGVWISAYAPGGYLPNKDKRVIVESNFKINSYIDKLRKELGVIIIICVLGFIVVGFISYHMVVALISAIRKLDEAIIDLESEHYDKPIDVKTNDEIGHLAKAFEALRMSIRKKIDELRVSLKREKRAHLELVVALTNAIEERDIYTKGHVRRVQEYALLIGKAMRLDHANMVQLRYGCLLHDIGKIYIENALLNKGNLSKEEFDEIKKHAERGSKIIDDIEFLSQAKEVVLYHQECFDGSGYPRGLKARQIPLLARIVGVADAFDAMTTDRPYRGKMSFEKAMAEIEKKSGSQFDPEVCAAFLKYRDSIAIMAHKHLLDVA